MSHGQAAALAPSATASEQLPKSIRRPSCLERYLPAAPPPARPSAYLPPLAQVLSVFQAIGVKPDLFSMVFGESVLNDAVAIVLSRTLVSFIQVSAG